MQSGVLERIRHAEATIESCRRTIAWEKVLDIENPRHIIMRDHLIRQERECIRRTAVTLLDMYLDEDDLEAAQNDPTPPAVALRAFETQLAEIREYFRLHPIEGFTPIDSTVEDMLPRVSFSAAERHGKCLDLRPHYEAYESMMLLAASKDARAVEKVSRVDWATFMANPTVIFGLSQEVKIVVLDTYRACVLGLQSYLVDFFRRVRPLSDDVLTAALDEAKQKYDIFWESAVGDVQRRRDRQFVSYDTRGLPAPTIAMLKAIGHAEAAVSKLCASLLADVRHATVTIAQQRASRSAEELAQADAQDEDDFRASMKNAVEKRCQLQSRSLAHAADEDIAATLNPVVAAGVCDSEEEREAPAASDKYNVPLDVDGNPIPKWLEKLQGLRHKYSCQICGGTIFSGPKVFAEHFAAERHTEGLRRLGIANHRIFDGVCTISGALALAEIQPSDGSLKKRLREDEDEQQMEDAYGQVTSRRDVQRFQASR